jgi:transposase
MGRPTKLTTKTQAAICENLARGMTQAHAAQAAGISERTFYYWKGAGEKAEKENREDEFLQFLQSLKKANAEFEKTGTGVLYRASTEESGETTTTRKVIPVIDEFGVPQCTSVTGGMPSSVRYCRTARLTTSGDCFPQAVS